MRGTTILAVAAVLGLAPLAASATTVTMNRIDANGVGQPVGTVTLTETPQGLVLRPDLKGLPAGPRGFHVHQNPDCGPGMNNGQMAAGFAAGGHYDPADTKTHRGPQGQGHLGDLPALVVDQQGNANQPVVAQRLSMRDVQGRSLMIHAGGDNYADEPQPLGGGAGRIACGVIR